jgi:hypothetical protein
MGLLFQTHFRQPKPSRLSRWRGTNQASALFDISNRRKSPDEPVDGIIVEPIDKKRPIRLEIRTKSEEMGSFIRTPKIRRRSAAWRDAHRI